jgi:alpha-galactosidase
MSFTMPAFLRWSISVLVVVGVAAFVNAGAWWEATADSVLNAWQGAQPPFSFKYDGIGPAQFLGLRDNASPITISGPGGISQKTTYTDPATHLQVKAEIKVYHDFGAIDWVLTFKNNGTKDTPILEDIEPLDWTVAKTGDVTVHHAHGSKAEPVDFMPMTDVLASGKAFEMESTGGRSSQGSMPFFNAQYDGGGILGAIGWTGHWKADFSNDANGQSLHLVAGMAKTHLVLHPGEEIRTPRIVLMNWKGTDWLVAQNEWRKLMLAHYTVQEHGKPLVGPISYVTWGADTATHKLAQIKLVKDEKLPFDIFWIDASWYDKCVGHDMGVDATREPFWRGRGSWVTNKANYPEGLKPIGEAARAAGMKFLLWLEPEEADPDTILRKEHPEWFFPPNANNPGSAVVKMGDPVARKGITDLVSKIIKETGVDWYRQDYNLDPERTFTAADTPDRIGMAEIQYVEGLYTFLDDLVKQNPGLKIDNCASGGQRLDIEMLSRTTPLWRSDLAGPPNGDITSQTQTQGLAQWVPLNGAIPWTNPGPFNEDQAPPDPFDTKMIYTMRSGYSAAMDLGLGQAQGKDEAWCAKLRQQLAEYKEVQPYIYGDFYPLLPWSQEVNAAVAWQWDRPDLKSGVVIGLRRAGCDSGALKLELYGIDESADYSVEFHHEVWLSGPMHATPEYLKRDSKEMTGKELAHLGLDIAEKPGSVVVFYRKK